MNELLDKMIKNNIEYVYSFSNQDVETLFHLVDNYVKGNGLYEEVDSGKYNISKDLVGFTIGYEYGPDIVYYIKKLDTKDINNFIDIRNVYNNELTIRQLIIRNEINRINDMIDDLYKRGLTKTLIKKSIKM